MNQILQGNALTVLRELDGETIDTCVTSPPYYGLRDYGTSRWTGGIADCDHTVKEIRTGLGLAYSPASERGGGHKVKTIPKIQATHICPKCGAIRIDEQIGLEETPEEYISRLVEVFREVRRVLKSDGTLWVNIADSYSGSGKGSGGLGQLSEKQRSNTGAYFTVGKPLPKTTTSCKPKDLIGIPWLLALALRADGWYLRSDIIWDKSGNVFPESVKDRCTKSHEYIFMLAKSRSYYFDADAIKEPVAETSLARAKYGWHGKGSDGAGNYAGLGQVDKMGTRFVDERGRNKRDVWRVNTYSNREAHYATYPPELIRPCILAGSRKGGIVLDPFCGSGTTGLVAVQEGRGYALIDLNPEYVDMTRKRIEAEKAQVSLFEVTE